MHRISLTRFNRQRYDGHLIVYITRFWNNTAHSSNTAHYRKFSDTSTGYLNWHHRHTPSTTQYYPRPTASNVTANHTNTKKIRYVDDLSSAQYYLENGLRKVNPYYFDYLAHAKNCWVNRPCLSVLNTEFRDRNTEYFKMAIEKGFITINGQTVTNDTLFKKGDTMGHRVHRHEPPVTGAPIDIIHKDDDLLVIQKPGGIPAHPSGRYRHNTVVHILRKQYGLPSLYPINRLDRLTSGLMMIGLNANKARSIQQEMLSGSIEKEYLCRVDGEFPIGRIVCEAPMKTIAFKFSFQYVDFGHGGKPSKTIFERIHYNGRTSLVRCRPITGRTHQLRVHLRYLGYPIANDPVYGRLTPWSSQIDAIQPSPSSPIPCFSSVIDKMMEKTSYDSLDISDDQPRCSDCHSLLVEDPLPSQDLGIWLHAQRYSGLHWSFDTGDSLPSWTHLDFDKDQTIMPAYM
ncbi:unnamed protein product [Absidia cylindrospora]